MTKQNPEINDDSLKPQPALSDAYDFLAGGGEMGERIRNKDWSKTPLGSFENWPQSLQTIVRIMLTSRQPIWIGWGPELIKLYNDPYKAIVGGKHPEALGQPASVVWHDIWPDIEPMLKQVMELNEGTYVESQLLIMERYGYAEETYYTFSYNPVPLEQGRVGGMICTNTDDTQRVIGERQLALLRSLTAETVDARTIEEACRLAALSLEHNPFDLPFAMIYLLSPDKKAIQLAGTTNILPGHPAVPNQLDLDQDSSWPFKEVISSGEPVLIPELEKYFDKLPTGGWPRQPKQAVAVPIVSSGETGQAGVLVVGLNPFRKYDEGYQGFIKLVTGQIASGIANAQAYEEARKRAEALAEIDRAKTTFFNNVSHEFRTPLTLMLGPIEDIMAERASLPREEQERAEILHRNSLRLLRLVNALLDFSRIEAGRVQGVYEPTDLARFTAELASSFRSAIERAGMQLIVETPPVGEPVYVDREMWEKIVLNLLSNAFKYTLHGTITVSITRLNNEVELCVADTGVGIPEEEIPHLFERFHRVEGVEGRTHEGTGIGLALVQELVKLHGGTITASSKLGQGTTLRVIIPLGTVHLVKERVSTGNSNQVSNAIGNSSYVEEALRWLSHPDEDTEYISDLPIKSSLDVSDKPGLELADTATAPRILLADDNADMRQYIKRLLKPKYQVETAPDGAAALALIQTKKIDLVLSDVMMPRLDGFGLLKALRANPATQTLPVIMLSARAGEEAHIEGLEEGADDYLVKPFSARELLARIGAHLSLAQVRQQAQNAILRSKEEVERQRKLLYQTFMQAPVAISVLSGPDLVFEIVNPMTQKMLAKREVLGKPLREALPELNNEILENYVRVYQTGQSLTAQEFPAYLDWENNGYIYPRFWDFVFEPRRAENGEIDGIISVATDVTTQVRARQTVEEQNRVLELVASGTPLNVALDFLITSMEKHSTDRRMRASILLVDKDGKHLRHGAAPSLPRDYITAIDGLEIGPVAGSFGAAAYTGQPVIVADTTTDPLWEDFKALAAAHNLRSCWSIPIFGSDQSVLGTFAMYYDEPHVPAYADQLAIDFATRTAALAIERSKAEANLRESEERFRTLADNISQLAWMADEQGYIYWYNQRWYDFTGTTLPQVMGSGWQTVLHPDHRKRVIDKISQHFQNGQDWEDTFPMRDKDNEFRWFLSRAIPIRDEKGKVIRWFGTNTDITERQELEHRRDEFIGIASHELKTPLTSIKGYVQIVERMIRGSGNEKATMYLNRTNTYIDRLNSLIADLLDVSRIQAGKLQFNMSEFNFDDLVAEGVESIQPTASHHRIEVIGKADRLVTGDRNRLEQVFTNLLTNAIKYSPQADRVVVTVCGNADRVEVAVQDFGIGIAEENQSSIFDRFYRVESSAKSFSGLGIGLYICKEIIVRHNGELKVESQEGSGSTFTFSLPTRPFNPASEVSNIDE